MKKDKWKRRVFVALVIVWMITIFCFSARNAELSTYDSNRVGLFIGKMVHSDFEDWTPQEQLAFAERIDHPIRKISHASEYCLLAVLLMGAVGTVESKAKRGLFSWLIATGYACTDEYHQLFVPGRAGQVKDVCIDSSGAVIGVILVLIGLAIWQKRRKKC